jgi:hypothetical protein
MTSTIGKHASSHYKPRVIAPKTTKKPLVTNLAKADPQRQHFPDPTAQTGSTTGMKSDAKDGEHVKGCPGIHETIFSSSTSE